jgi:tRNA nucleotidyltransferase (CCA-adding enzyme)
MPYREEIKYDNRRPIDYFSTDDIVKDSERRDFTINSLYMDVDGNISDPFNGKVDLENKLIRVIGDIDIKFSDDPLRILRAIRFASILNFDLDTSINTYIALNKELLSTLSFDRRKSELDKIFKNENKITGINLIKDLGLEDILGIKFNEDLKYTISSEGIWAQISSPKYNFSKSESVIIDSIKKIVEYGIIDNIVLYQYGLYPCVIAGEILGINEAHVSNLYSSLPIYTKNDINCSGDDIINLLSIEPGIKVKKILNDIELNILNGDLNNNREELLDYIKKNWE